MIRTVNSDNNNHWEVDILKQLDDYAQEYDFPMLNNVYLDNADIRLKVFRTDYEWLVIFEEIAFSQQNYSFINSISAYGNKIQNPGTQQAINIISELPEQPIWDNDNNFSLDRCNFEVIINGSTGKFIFSLEDYKKAGIDFESDIRHEVQILRLLTYTIPDELFLTDNGLLDIFGRQNSDLKKFIHLKDWYHPDIANDQLPSQNECFQNLALAISRNNINLYSCYEDSFNTHWSNWELE